MVLDKDWTHYLTGVTYGAVSTYGQKWKYAHVGIPKLKLKYVMKSCVNGKHKYRVIRMVKLPVIEGLRRKAEIEENELWRKRI